MIHNQGAEFLEIDLTGLYVLTKVEVQGRFGNGQGREYAEKYKIQYWRDGLDHWINYKDGRGNEVSLCSVVLRPYLNAQVHLTKIGLAIERGSSLSLINCISPGFIHPRIKSYEIESLAIGVSYLHWKSTFRRRRILF